MPPDLLHVALGVHPETGTGTAYEGFLSVSWRRGGEGGHRWAVGLAGPPMPAFPIGASTLGCPAGLAAGVRCPQ